MKRIAHIIRNTVHNIFEAPEIPNWPPYTDGTLPVLVDISSRPEIQERWRVIDLGTLDIIPPFPYTQEEVDSVRHGEILRMLDDLDLRIIRPDTNIMAAKLRDEEPEPEDVALLKEFIELKDILREELREIIERMPTPMPG